MSKSLEERYAEEVSAEALARQRLLAKRFYPCCGWRRDQGHHPMCPAAPKARE